MLVLSRKVGERIHVGDDITVEIRRIAGNRVTIALAAPRDVRILRGELERAAREFRETAAVPEDCSPRLPTTDRRVTIASGLPTSTVERDFAM